MALAACGLEVSGLDGASSVGDEAGVDATVDVSIETSTDDVQGGDDGGEEASDDASDDIDIADVDLDGGLVDARFDAEGGTAVCTGGTYACGDLCVKNCALCLGKVGCALGNVCVTSCQASCGGNTTACYECNGGTAVATCQDPKTATCLDGPYAHCGCNGTLPCPGETFCAGGPGHTACFTCGEKGSKNHVCGASTGTCDEGKAMCK